MTNQQWSVLLETVSFFFVAIDLYGRERLEMTHISLMATSERLSLALNSLQKQKWNADRNKRFVRLVYVVSGLIALIIGLRTDFFSAVADAVTIGTILLSIFLFSVLYVLCLLITLVAVAVLLFIGVSVLWIFKSSIGTLIQLLRFTNFEGLLLITGSTLFVVSKYLQLLT